MDRVKLRITIDKEYFVYKLTKRGFATGIMEQHVKEEQKNINRINKKIKKYKEKIIELRKELSDIT